MTNSEVVNELNKMTKRAEVLTTVLKKKNANHYTPENITQEENDLIYDNLKILDSVNWDAERLDNYIASNKRLIKSLS